MTRESRRVIHLWINQYLESRSMKTSGGPLRTLRYWVRRPLSLFSDLGL